jgi:mRNA-degrading endonuclease RelE of RelBE toxin-antitoxin system
VAAYTVDARPRVRKALRQLDPKVRKDVLAKMRALASEPRPVGAESSMVIRRGSGYELVITGSSMR